MLEIKGSPEKLYHYTDLHALMGIIGASELWLTNVGFLNDHTEYTVGRVHIKRKLTEFVEMVTEKISNHKLGYDFEFVGAIIDRPVYLTSFCMKKDLLSQWRGYCPPQGGYALEFSGQEIADSISHNTDTRFLICNYDTDSSKNNLDQAAVEVIRILTNAMTKEEARDSEAMFQNVQELNGILFSTLIHKHESFSEEEEVRLACQSTTRKIKFRVKDCVLVPYVPMEIDVNSITKIIIGPMVDQPLAKKGLQHFLQSLLDDQDHPMKKLPEIELSSIPLR